MGLLRAAPSAIQRQAGTRETPAALPASPDGGVQLCPPCKLQEHEGHSAAEEQGPQAFLFVYRRARDLPTAQATGSKKLASELFCIRFQVTYGKKMSTCLGRCLSRFMLCDKIFPKFQNIFLIKHHEKDERQMTKYF